MSTLSYTTGNPSNLAAGVTASMNDIQGPFTDIRTFVNGANLDYGNIAAVVDSYYKTVKDVAVQSAGLTAATYVFGAQGNAGISGLVLPSAGLAGLGTFYLDSSMFPSGTRTPKLRVSANWLTNNVAPAVTYTYGLYQVTATAGGGATNSITLSAVVASSTVTNATPGANIGNFAVSGDISFPTTGHYVLGVVVSGTEATNAAVIHRAALQFRAV